MSDPTDQPGSPSGPVTPHQSGYGQPDYGQPGFRRQPFPQHGYAQPDYVPGGYSAAPGWGPSAAYSGPQDPMISPDYAGWWKRSLTVLRRCWPQLAALQAIPLLLNLVLQIVLIVQLAPIMRRLEEQANAAAAARQPTPGFIGEFFGDYFTGLLSVLPTVLIGVLIVGVPAVIAELAAVRVVVDGATGDRIELGAALRVGVRRFVPMLGWWALSGLLITVGLCCVALPGIYLAVLFGALLPSLVVLERNNPVGRAFTLAHRDLGVGLSRLATLFGFGFLVWIVSVVSNGVAGAVDGSPAAGGLSYAGDIGATIVVCVLAAVLRVLTVPLAVLAYADMRARVEPLSAQALRDAARA